MYNRSESNQFTVKKCEAYLNNLGCLERSTNPIITSSLSDNLAHIYFGFDMKKIHVCNCRFSYQYFV